MVEKLSHALTLAEEKWRIQIISSVVILVDILFLLLVVLPLHLSASPRQSFFMKMIGVW